MLFNFLNAQQQAAYNEFLQTSSTKEALESVTAKSFNDKVFVIDQAALVQKGGGEYLQEKFSLGSDHSFTVLRTTSSGIDLVKAVTVYQHHYKGVPVEGSGYTMVTEGEDVFDVFSAKAQNGPVGPRPCSVVRMLNFYVASLDANNVTGSELDVPSTQDISAIAAELNVNFSDLSYGYLLKWSADLMKYEYFNEILIYSNGSYHHVGYFSVRKGFVQDERLRGVPGETLIYGTIDINDREVGNRRQLVTADGELSTYDVTGVNNNLICDEERVNCDNGVLDVDFFIPETPLAQWPVGSDLDRHILQTHHAYTLALEEWNTLLSSLDFPLIQNVKVAATSDPERNSATFPWFRPSSSFIRSNFKNGVSDGLFDIAGHEFTHVQLGGVLPFFDINSNTLHEAIAGMMGVYIESKVAGEIDWLEGDDDPNRPVVFDYENLRNEIFTQEVLNDNNEYFRGTPLLHWYYLLVNGEPALDISPIGIDRTA